MGLLKSPNHCCNVNTQDGVVTSPMLNIVSCFIMFINLYYNSFSYQPHVSECQAFIFVMLFFNAFLEKVSHPLIDTTSLLPAAVDIPVLFFHLSVCVAKNKRISVSHSEIIFFPKSCSPSGYHDLMTSVLEIVISGGCEN